MTGIANRSVRPSPASENGGALILSSSLLTDRMLLYTDFLEVLSGAVPVKVWATSLRNARRKQAWSQSRAVAEEFPPVSEFREIPYNYMRRLNEFVWDFRLSVPSRLSMQRHIRDKNQKLHVRGLKIPARALASLGAERAVEAWTEQLLLSYSRSPEAESRLRAMSPALVLTTGPFWYWEPAVVAAAKRLSIPTVALIPSWDNLSTKGRMVFRYDGYLVWSEEARRQLHQLYPESRHVPVDVVGAPQFDIFFQKRFHRSREEFCAAHRLRADRPILLYAVGSPNFLKEHHGALEMAERVDRGHFGDAQLLVRPHPIHDNAEMAGLFARFGPRVALQQTAEPRTPLAARSQDEGQITEWVNTFRHADVVINLSSTVTVDAALFDRPIVNLDYDPEPGQPNQGLVRDLNHRWTHFKPIAESGGVWLVENPDAMANAVKTYLNHPELHREKRRWIVEYVCGYTDGKCGKRMASAVLEHIRPSEKSVDQRAMSSPTSPTRY